MAPISQETNLEIANWAKVAELRVLQRGVHSYSASFFASFRGRVLVPLCIVVYTLESLPLLISFPH